MRQALRSARLRSLLVYLAIVAVVFSAALGAAFVFAHEPQREIVSITVRETPLTPPASYTIAGVISAIRDGEIVLAGEELSTTVELPAGIPLDELTRVAEDGPLFAPGTAVNLGTADTETGFIVTGIVAVEAATR